MKITGTVIEISETEHFGQNFSKRNIIIETDEQYPQKILIEFHKDNADYLDRYGHGQRVDIYINIRGKEWTSPQGEVKYFNSLVGWKIESAEDSGAKPAASAPPDNKKPELPKPEPDLEPEDQDDLPF